MSEFTQIKLFEEKNVRSVWNDKEQHWYFSVIDVVEVLTESVNPRDYWFKMIDQDGKNRETDCAILTAEISKATFGLTPSKYKNVKGLTN